MSPERWQKIQALFEQTLERGVPDRRAFLEQACGDDTALRDEVASLLTADQQAGSFMSEHSVGLDLDSPPEGEAWIGRNIGPYKILRPIGHGGMSTVFLAARDDDEYRGQVAIKVTRRGPGSADLRQRFLRERQILADLNHPNIAQLHDAGTTSEGIPYFVMELVDGVSILEFCDRQRLPIAARLELFLEVCNAVQAAHRSLIVHRDIKPANLLITSDGRPKLLDFGIAKPLDPATLAESLEATRTWQRPMTLAYASPEQIRGKSLSTATDVYSLGVVLYELLTGRHPHRSSTDTLSDLEGAILQRPPQRPSTAIEPVGGPPIDPAEDRPDADEIGRRRNVNPHQLQRQLRGDLDNIVLMALRKDPARRYSSVEQMAEDLRRYQDGLPVVARPSSLGYRSRKFVGRNKLAVGTAALIVLLVLGFGVAMAFQTAQITRERDLARAAIERGSELASRLAILAESQEEALDELEQERALRLEAEAERLALAGQSEEAESLRREVETTKSELLERAQALDALRDALDDKDSAAAAQPTEAPPNSLLESRLQAAEQQRQAEAARALEAETRQATLERQLQEAQDQISSLERPAPETSSGPPPCQAGEEVVDQAIAFVRICTGTFTMGSAEDDTQAIDLEKPAHSVTLSEFWLGKYEVTNEQYRRWRPDHPGEADLPATGVSWSRARRFCQQYGFDLPTEAEWEFAARAGSQTLWAFGNDEGELGRFAWYAANSTGSPQPVGRKEPNRWGLYDMHGNVWEWIGGLRGPYSAGPKVDPKGLTPALARSRRQGPRSITSEDDAADLWVVRGGSYDAPPTDLRVAARGGSRPSARSPEIGFRCVRRITSE